MSWEVIFDDTFEQEFDDLLESVQDELFAQTKVLKEFGPTLGRPRVDTLKGSRHPNMKELRFNVDNGVWRVAFAFDPKRQAILLVCGDKAGTSERKFYKQLIRKADTRFDAHLMQFQEQKIKGEIKWLKHWQKK
ncbi:MAG TPA: type II toxin-antitoxin system RelE/ParE family toxin [Candidatus Binatia bacterium]